MTTLKGNKDLVHRLYNTLMARGDVDSANQILADDYIDHDLPGIGEGGKVQLIQVVQGVRASLPDITPTLYETLAEDDLVSVRVIARGTHRRALPTRHSGSGSDDGVEGDSYFRCRNGQIAERWGVFDMLSILQQLGAIPA